MSPWTEYLTAQLLYELTLPPRKPIPTFYLAFPESATCTPAIGDPQLSFSTAYPYTLNQLEQASPIQLIQFLIHPASS
ncbi:hypothetical protein BDV40DRAFT_273550 [Aspergillus tamarii]|uniref:Uncharacterized protein n=1 Tax=Aspergillus tamarii TaxID=41984 RepID=A0A5N6ULM4_ASPTM|nr:hypothetical protein BDV40DRAFT_273550 [Aspergillus tamarii]